MSMTALGNQGGIPNNPMHPGKPGEPGQPGQPGVPGGGQQTQPSPGATAAAVAANKADVQAIEVSSISTSAVTNQTALVLRSLTLNPHSSFDLWSNATGTFDRTENVASISAGFDYRITPRWIVGLLGNWAMAEHIKGDAMDGGLYTAASQWGFYLIASEIMHRNPENYFTYAQLGYAARLGCLSGGPFYAVQYGTRRDTLQNQAGGWLSLPIGKWSPEVQVMWENNCKESAPSRRDLIWAGATLNYEIKPGLFINAGYNWEGNRHFKDNQVTVGFKIQLP